ncbi:MAG: hypothetical protein ACRCUT_15330 [Spirochaetota bacterium]
MKRIALMCIGLLLFFTACVSNQIKVRKDDITNKTYMTYERKGTTGWKYRYDFVFTREIEAKEDSSYIAAKLYLPMNSDSIKEDVILKCGQTVLTYKVPDIKSSVYTWQRTSKDVQNSNVYQSGQQVGTVQTTTTTVKNEESMQYSFNIPVTSEMKKAFSVNPDAAFRFYAGTDPITITFTQQEVQKISQLLTQTPESVAAQK